MIIINATPPDTCRITCQAAPGAKVVATGEEPLKGWTHVTNDPWKAVILALLLAAPLLAAAPVVQVEQGRIEGASWRFPSIVSPRTGDLAEQAKLRLATGGLDRLAAPLATLADGVIANRGDDPAQVVFLSNANADGGRVLMDLGEVRPIAQINTYSFHHFPPDGGARGPQVYTLYGSAANTPDAADLARWTKITAVDSRPNPTGNDWGGIHGVQIADDTGGLLGRFRHLLWDLHPTGSPRASQPSRANTFYVEFDVHAPGALEDAQPARLAAAGAPVDRFVLVYKTHFDIGYTKLAREVMHDYKTTLIDQALAVVDQNATLPREQQFAWTLPGWPMKEIAADWPGQSPERQRRIEAAFKDGRFVVHALPFTLHTDIMEPEELVRGLGFASRLNRSIGKPLPRAAKMTDVPCHPWLLPTALRHAGVEFLHLGCNGHSSPVEVPVLFWWEGPDGSRLLTYYSPDGYGTGLLPPPNWPHKTWLALVHSGDNHGPPRPAEVRADLERIRQAYPDAKVIVGELSDFSDALLAEKPDLPVLRLDMPDTWIHGPLASPIGVRLSRTIRPRLAAAEMLGTLLGETTAAQAAEIARAYESSLLFSEHTWGLYHPYLQHKFPDGETWTREHQADRYARIEESWAEHRAYIDDAARRTEALLAANLEKLARAVDAPGPRTVVFNPLPWQRSGIVEVNGLPRFVKDVPAGGWLTLPHANDPSAPSAPSAPSVPSTLESPHFRLTLAPDRAAITSLIDKRTGRELVRQDAGFGLGEYLYQQFSREDTDRFRNTYTRNRNPGFGKDWLPGPDVMPRIDARPQGATWSLTRGHAADVAEARSPAGHGVPHATRLRVTLHHHQPLIDLEVTIENMAANPRPEASWICLPLAVDQPAFRLARPGGIANPATDFVRASNRHLIALHSGMTVTAPDGTGVGLCSPDTPLVSLDRPGAWEFSRDFIPARPDVFVHLYNNMWSTNFRLWKAGTWSTRVRLWPVASPAAGESLITPSWETLHPLLAATADGPCGHLPASRAGLAVSRVGVPVTAFGPNPDGPGTLLRLWEMAGVSGEITVTLPGGFTAATPVNLRGEKSGDSVPLTNGKLSFRLAAFAPASFFLE